jgi:hypothetical protein
MGQEYLSQTPLRGVTQNQNKFLINQDKNIKEEGNIRSNSMSNTKSILVITILYYQNFNKFIKAISYDTNITV